jgi:Fe-S-cluster containining protein
MPAGVSLAELIYLYHGMHRTGIFARWFRRCLETEECFSALVRGGHPAEASAAPCCGRLDEVLTRFRAHGPGCTFLREDVCQLYAYRPIACRMHYSLSPRYWCDPRHARLSEAVVFNLEPSPAVYEAFELLEQRMGIKLSDVLAVGILELTVNVMQFNKIQWSA